MIRRVYGRAERRHPPAAGRTVGRISRALSFQLFRTYRCASAPGLPLRAAATAARAATSAAISSASASPRTTWRNGLSSATRLADADAEFSVHACPERVPQPLAGLLVGAQRLAELLLRLDEQLFVDDGWQDR